MKSGSITDADVTATGLTMEALARTVVTHDGHSALS
jgi:hypothetical protein